MQIEWLPPSLELPEAPAPTVKTGRAHDPQASGITTRPTDSLCCPQCHSLIIVKRDMRKCSARITWECRDCRHLWPLPATAGQVRSAIA